MQHRLFLDVVVAYRESVPELLAGEYEALLVWWNALLIPEVALCFLKRVRDLI